MAMTKPIHESQCEAEPMSLPLHVLDVFIPAIEAGARSLRRDVARARKAFRPTDMEQLQREARALEALAAHINVRQPRKPYTRRTSP